MAVMTGARIIVRMAVSSTIWKTPLSTSPAVTAAVVATMENSPICASDIPAIVALRMGRPAARPASAPASGLMSSTPSVRSTMRTGCESSVGMSRSSPSETKKRLMNTSRNGMMTQTA